MRIGVIGTGVIASAVVDGIAGDGHQITVSERSREKSAALAARHANVSVAGNQGVVDASDLVFIALMADAAPAILSDLTFREGQQVVSFMAGFPLDALRPLVAPARVAALVLPFPAVAIGGSAVISCPQADVVDAVFGVNNHVVTVPDEAGLVPFMAAQSLLSPAVKLLDEAAGWMAERTRDRAGAERFLRILIGGGIAAAPYDRPGVLAGMLADLNTEGGFNAQLRQHFEAAGMFDTLREGLDILERRQTGDK